MACVCFLGLPVFGSNGTSTFFWLLPLDSLINYHQGTDGVPGNVPIRTGYEYMWHTVFELLSASNRFQTSSEPQTERRLHSFIRPWFLVFTWYCEQAHLVSGGMDDWMHLLCTSSNTASLRSRALFSLAVSCLVYNVFAMTQLAKGVLSRQYVI